MPWENKRWLMGVSVHFYHLCLVQLFWSKLHTVSNKEKTGKQGWLRQNAHGSVCLFFLGTAHSIITSHPCTTRWKAWLLSDSLNIYILSAVASVFHQMIAWTQGWDLFHSDRTNLGEVVSSSHGQCWWCQPFEWMLLWHSCGDSISTLLVYIPWPVCTQIFSPITRGQYYHLPHKSEDGLKFICLKWSEALPGTELSIRYMLTCFKQFLSCYTL